MSEHKTFKLKMTLEIYIEGEEPFESTQVTYLNISHPDTWMYHLKSKRFLDREVPPDLLHHFSEGEPGHYPELAYTVQKLAKQTMRDTLYKRFGKF